MIQRLIQVIGAGFAFAVLTAITQLSGIVFLAALVLFLLLRRAGAMRLVAAASGLIFFVASVALGNLYVVPPLALSNGRVPLPCRATEARPYGALSPIYCVLGRNYVRAEVMTLMDQMARDLQGEQPGLVVAYLDTGFPFLDGFPLPPHLSHDDGRRIDLAYFYKDSTENYRPLTTPSPLGYWGFESPAVEEPPPCADKVRWLTFRWDMVWFQAFVRKDLVLDQERTAQMLRWLVEYGPAHGVEKILIEPHVAKRLGVSSPLIRFQGCRAARHDDHLHVEVRSP